MAQFVEVHPDSNKTDGKARPAFKSDRRAHRLRRRRHPPRHPRSGRHADDRRTRSSCSRSQPSDKSSTPCCRTTRSSSRARSPRTSRCPPAWSPEVMRRIAAADVKIDPKLTAVAAQMLTRDLANRVTRLAFGDAAAKARIAVRGSSAHEGARAARAQHDTGAAARRERSAEPSAHSDSTDEHEYVAGVTDDSRPAPHAHHLRVQRTARYYTLGGDVTRTGRDLVSAARVRPARRRIHSLLLGSCVRRFASRRTGGDESVLSREPGQGDRRANGPSARSWMTREDRASEIADYVEYLDALFDAVTESASRRTARRSTSLDSRRAGRRRRGGSRTAARASVV